MPSHPPSPDESAAAADSPARVGFHVSAFGSHQVLAALSALSASGFQGLEIYADTTHIFADRPEEFRDILEISGIGLAGVHGGGLLTSDEFRHAEIAEWTRLIEWTARVGGQYAIFYGGESHEDYATDLRRAASFLNEIGRYAASHGVQLCYEPDKRCPFSTKERITALMERTKPEWVRLSADTAHLAEMGVDPAFFLLAQRQRVAVVHLRDLRDPRTRPAEEPKDAAPDALAAPVRREFTEEDFVTDTGPGDVCESTDELDTSPIGRGWTPYTEIGEGTIDLQGVADALRALSFDGWIVGVVDSPARSAHESARAAAAYFREFLGLKF